MTIFSRSKRVLLNLMLALSIGTIAPTIALAQTTTASHSNQNEPANKKLNLSPLFVDLSDAMGASKHHDFDQAKVQLTQINRAFSDLESRDSPMGKQVATALQ